jgi:hypothetical protein
MTEKKELSQLARQLLSNGGAVDFYTQKEFDRALLEARSEIMAIAIQTTRQAIAIEREECARLADETEQHELAMAIRQRLSGKPH